MARPEGYRKASRLMQLAGQFGLPVLSFVDTAGAILAAAPKTRPGRGHRERHQVLLKLPTPMVAAILVKAVRGRYCACHWQPGGDVRACDLLCDLAGGLCVNLVAKRRPCA